MKRKLNKMLSVIVAFVLLFVAVPFDNAHASATEFATVSAWLNSLTEGEHAFISGQKNTPNAVEKYLFTSADGTTAHERGRGYGISGVKVTVDSLGNKNLVVSFKSSTKYTGISAGTATVNLEADGEEEGKFKYNLTISNITAGLFVPLADANVNSDEAKQSITPNYAVKLNGITCETASQNAESAVVLFNLPIKASTGDNSGNGGNSGTDNAKPATSITVKIIRNGNANSGTGKEYGSSYYVSECKTEDNKLNAKVTVTGGFTKLFYGTFEDAEVADSSLITTLTAVDGKVVIPVKDITLGTPVTIALYSGAMDKWLDYKFIFTSAACDHTYANGLCSKCGAIDFTANSENVVVSDTKVEVKATSRNDVVITNSTITNITGKELGLTTKVGTVVFDANAVAGLVGATTDVTFTMEDLKDTPLYKRAKYDMVLDLNLKDALGNNLFPAGSNGKATITVPYEKEVPAGKTVYVYYITDDGRESVDATYDATNKTVTFVVEHFSTYALTQDAVPNTNDTMIPVAMISLAMMEIAGVVIVDKKKKSVM